MIRLFKPFALSVLLLFTSWCASAVDFNTPQYTQKPFGKLEIAQAHPYTAPHHIFKSSDGAQWFIYRDKLLQRLGSVSQIHPLPGAESKYLGRDAVPTIRSVEFQQKILFSYNSQIIYFDRHSETLHPWLDLSEQRDVVTGMQVVSDKQLWITTLRGVFTADTLSSGVKEVTIPSALMPSGIPTIGAYTLEKTGDDTLWIGSFFSSIYKVTIDDLDQPVFQRFKNDTPDRMIVYSLKPLTANKFLVGTSSGLFEFDRSTGKFSERGDFTEVADIHINGTHTWFTADRQLYFNLSDQSRFNQVQARQDLGLKTDDLQVTGVYSDNESNIWISVKNHGVFHYSIYNDRIKKVADNLIDSENRVWRLFHLGEDEMVYSNHEKTIIMPGHQSADLAGSSYFNAGDGNYFIGHQGKVSWFNDSGLVTVLDSGLTNDVMTSIVVDKYQRLWSSAQLSGLHLWDLTTTKPLDVKHIDKGGNTRARHLSLSTNGRIHIVSNRAIEVFEPNQSGDKKVLQLTWQHDASRIYRQGSMVMIHHRDLSISRYDIESEQLQNFTFSDFENIGCVANKGDAIWWFALNDGHLVRYDNDSGQSTIFSEKDGLTKGGLTGEWCAMHRGQFFFSAYKGFVRTATAIAGENPVLPTSVIHKVTTRNMELLLPAMNANAIVEHDEFPVTLDFYQSSLVDQKSSQNRYKLAGLHQDWHYLKPGNQQVSFDNLAPGNYRFILQSSNNDGLWGKESQISLLVHPPIWWRWWAKLIYLVVGLALVYLILQMRTRTLQKRAQQLEQVVAQRTQALEQVLDLKNREFANVSHEFRTPLTLILGPVKKLLARESLDEHKRTLSVIQRNGYRLLRMVDQLLHLEKFRVQQVTERAPVQVKPIVSIIADAFVDLAAEKGIQLNVNQIDDVWLLLTPDVLEKSLLNLLSNAIKYTPEGGNIHLSITTSDDENSVQIKVSDNGIGIAPEHHDAVFDRFNRIMDDYSEKITGAGIGLALVKELVDSHGGSVKVQSQKGQGATFSIHLPRHFPSDSELTQVDGDRVTDNSIVELEIESIVEQDTVSKPDSTLEQVEQTDNRARILVVEDNIDMRNYIVDVLSQRYGVSSTGNGKQGLEAAKQHVPDLIISDVMMPQMDGFELCLNIKSLEVTCHIPLILLTARMDRDSRMQGWKDQADEYLTKPFDSEELLLRVENLLAVRELLKGRFLLQQNPLTTESSSTQSQVPEKPPLSEWEIQAQAFLTKFNAEIEKHLCNADLKVEQLAKQLAMSERQLYRKLKGVLNVTPAEHLRNVRLQRSLELIAQKEAVGNIAFMVGFSSHSYFCKCFKAKFGKTPSEMAENG